MLVCCHWGQFASFLILIGLHWDKMEKCCNYLQCALNYTKNLDTEGTRHWHQYSPVKIIKSWQLYCEIYHSIRSQSWENQTWKFTFRSSLFLILEISHHSKHCLLAFTKPDSLYYYISGYMYARQTCAAGNTWQCMTNRNKIGFYRSAKLETSLKFTNSQRFHLHKYCNRSEKAVSSNTL